MAYATAALPNVGAYGVGVVAPGAYRRFAGGVAVGLGTLGAAGVTAGSVTGLAVWMLAASLTANTGLNARTAVALETAALTGPYHRLAGIAELSGLTWVGSRSSHVADLMPAPGPALAALDAPAAKGDLQVSQPPVVEKVSIPLPPARPPLEAAAAASHESAPSAPAPTVKSRLASVMPSASTLSVFQKTLMSAPSALHALVPGRAPSGPAADAAQLNSANARATAAPRSNEDDARLITASLPPQQNRDRSVAGISRDSHTAIYDISAHVVYLPDGERLEAHSGLGFRLDDPRYIRDKARGPTPPNVYELVLREELFHGVRAIRLNPVDDGKMYGRDGILAHPYMLGPSGQSFGCVSFKDYQRFLQAFLRGDVERIVVVPHLQDQPITPVRTSRDRAGARTDFD